MPKIKVLPQNKVIELEREKDLYSGLKEAGFHINSTCGGCASCGSCTINIVEGEENLNEIPFEEKQLMGNVFHITKERLSCQTKAHGPVTIDISMHEQPENPKTSKKIKRRTKQEVSQIAEKREEERKQRPKRLGGGKKPKAFDYRDEEKDEYKEDK